MIAVKVNQYPPKLVGITETEFGSLMVLSNGRDVPIDVQPGRLSRALVERERPCLSDLLLARSLDIYADVWNLSAEDWQRISDVVRASPIAVAVFAPLSSIWEAFVQPAALVRDLPQRVYGGLDRALYTLHPFAFRPDPNRPTPWCRALLSASAGRVFDTWVNLANGQVEVETGTLPGHFVE